MFGFGAWKSISARSPRSVVTEFCAALAAGDSVAAKDLLLASAMEKPNADYPTVIDAAAVSEELATEPAAVTDATAAANTESAAWEKYPDLKFYISRLTVADQRAVAIVDLTIAGETMPVVIQLARSSRREWKIAGFFRPDTGLNSQPSAGSLVKDDHLDPAPSPITGGAANLQRSSPADMDRLATEIESALKQAAVERADTTRR